MKRLVCFILAFLIVPVLAVPASAAEVYEFEYMEMPAVLNDSFPFQAGDMLYVYDGLLPVGMYDIVLIRDILTFYSMSPVTLAFDQYDEENGEHCFASVQFNNLDSGFDLIFLRFDNQTFLVIGEGGADPLIQIVLTRVGDLPGSGDIGLTGFLDSVKTGFIEYSTANFAKVIFFGLVLVCSPVLAWFGYRFLKRKVTKSFFKGRL